MNKNIYICTEEEFEFHIENNQSFDGKRNYLLNLISTNKKFKNLRGFKQLRKKYTNKISNSFINNYLELFSNLSEINHSRIWWCNEHVSRNRFTSKLPYIVASYVEIINAIENISYDNIIILVSDTNEQRKIKNLIFKKSGSLKFAEKIYYNIKNFVLLTKNLFTLFYRHFLSKIILDDVFVNVEENSFLVKSHFYCSSINHSGLYNDSFFPNIKKLFKNKNKLNYLVHIHDDFLKSLYNIRKIKNANILPYEFFLNYTDIIKCYFKIINKSDFAFKNIKFLETDITTLLEEEFMIKPISLGHLTMYNSVKNILKKNKFKKILLTYENIAWENMLISAVKNYSPKTEIIGCQHTVIPQAALGMFLKKKEIKFKPLPHKLITTGFETKKIIQKYSSLTGYNVISGFALRYQGLHKRKLKNSRRNIKSILVALEGIPQAIELVEELFKQKKDLKDYKIIIRTHNVLPWDRIKKYSKIKIDLDKNLIVSKEKETFKDIMNSDLCIYWGSTVSLEAGYIGVPLINFDNNNIISYDPLFATNNLKWSFKRGDSIKKIIDKIETMSLKKLNLEKRKLRKYIQNYLSRIEKNSVENLFL